ncbi:unnamed protein product [Rangifer tarandus platyrhynchus]|uniref:Uncharacterized protein n=2 Tax=Rangifer tarandus platyrhynchus TaxID=3082113 RepID=A0ACB0E6R0_RANTA|nr:unnamed protein product [Rangifer tarandus platyrhynchus]CAI9696340.1 unnamed protein product [Rangifer tarandus platyrhynchus]
MVRPCPPSLRDPALFAGPAARLRTEGTGRPSYSPLPGTRSFTVPTVLATSSRCSRTTLFYPSSGLY